MKSLWSNPRLSEKALFASILFAAFACGEALAQNAPPRRYPNDGTFSYSSNQAQAFFSWLNSGGWATSDSAFELDIDTSDTFYTGCEGETTLPEHFSDCGTAGDFDPAGRTLFGVGSFNAHAIAPAPTIYQAHWNFTGGTDNLSEYAFLWQELRNNCLGLNFKWCLLWDFNQVSLMKGILSKATTEQRWWKVRDGNLGGAGGEKLEPDGAFWNAAPGRHIGYLIGPAGTNFDLYLQKWSSSGWIVVASSENYGSNEPLAPVNWLEYVGAPGYFSWKVVSRSGSGNYQISVSGPLGDGIPSLSVALAASPSGGNAPLSNVSLTATIGDTSPWTINYTFYCNCSDSGTNVTCGYAARYAGISGNTKTAIDICDYSSPGTYTPKVIVERGGVLSEDRATVVVSSSSSACWPLTKERNTATGGSLPLLGLTNSSGCATGTYRAGEEILVAVVPNSGWSVESWRGTIRDSSKANANAVVMPAGPHAVRVNYSNAPVACYDLTRDHTGEGDDPRATPSNSPGCASGDYVAGEVISVEADPDNGWMVEKWDGTESDGSTSTVNSVRMPPRDHMVEVRYENTVLEEFELTIEVVGSGQGRVTTSPGSISCGNYPGGGANCDNLYAEDTRVKLETDPRNGSTFTAWEGDDDCYNGIVYMHRSRSCRARFSTTSTTCRPVVLWAFGDGAPPVASPSSSSGCPSGYYTADTTIALSGAIPSSGWRNIGWQDTDNDSSTGSTNTLRMPRHEVTIIANYGRVDGRPTIETSQDVYATESFARVDYRFSTNGFPAQTFVQYGPTTDYGKATLEWYHLGNYLTPGGSADLPDLTCGSLYHARAVAVGTQGTSYGNDVTFVTAPCSPPAPMDFYTVTPCRVTDTRQSQPALSTGNSRTFPVVGTCGVPLEARAVSFNVTTVGATSEGYITLFPSDQPKPPTSTINFRAGQNRASNAILGLSSDGRISAVAAVGGGQVDLILDVNGYFVEISSP